MKKHIYHILGFLIMISLSFSSCVMDEDSAATGFQKRENIKVEDFEKEDIIGDDDSTDLKPGINRDTIIMEGAENENRIFKYYFPKSLDVSKPVSLVFYFHGSSDQNPIDNVSESHFMNRLANSENIIMVFPLGTIQEGTSTYNWTHDENLAFFDAMIDYFKQSENPMIDQNRVYACGQSSGAIFSFHLAMNRSEILAAVVPISGQYKIVESEFVKPTRTVAIRAINGMLDDKVIYWSAEENISVWANKVGEYSQTPVFENVMEIEDNYNTVNKKEYVAEVKYWKGGTNDIEFWGIRDEGHGVDWGVMRPFLWDFMKSHTLNDGKGAYMMLPNYTVKMKFGTTTNVGFTISSNTTCSVQSTPEGWDVEITNGNIAITAPAKDAGDVSGDIIFKLTKNGFETEKLLSVEAKETDGFQIGQYIESTDGYNDKLAIVYWVDPQNKYKAKAVSCNYGNKFYTYYKSGDGVFKWIEKDEGEKIDCSSTTDGKKNTNNVISVYTKLSNTEHAIAHGKNYRPKFGAYLPAVDELKELLNDEVLSQLNPILTETGLDPILEDALYWSSTAISVEGRDIQVFCRSANSNKDVIVNYDEENVHTRAIVKVGDWE